MKSPSGSLQHCYTGSACGTSCRSKLRGRQQSHMQKRSRPTSKRWHCNTEESSHHNASRDSHCAAMLLALGTYQQCHNSVHHYLVLIMTQLTGSQLLSQSPALAQQAAAEMLHTASDQPATHSHSGEPPGPALHRLALITSFLNGTVYCYS